MWITLLFIWQYSFESIDIDIYHNSLIVIIWGFWVYFVFHGCDLLLVGSWILWVSKWLVFMVAFHSRKVSDGRASFLFLFSSFPILFCSFSVGERCVTLKRERGSTRVSPWLIDGFLLFTQLIRVRFLWSGRKNITCCEFPNLGVNCLPLTEPRKKIVFEVRVNWSEQP